MVQKMTALGALLQDEQYSYDEETLKTKFQGVFASLTLVCLDLQSFLPEGRKNLGVLHMRYLLV